MATRFTDDGVWLVMLVRDDFHWYEDAEHGWMPWAELYALHLPTSKLTKSQVELAAKRRPGDPVDWTDRRWSTYGKLSTIDDYAAIALPWDDTIEIELPPKDVMATMPTAWRHLDASS